MARAVTCGSWTLGEVEAVGEAAVASVVELKFWFVTERAVSGSRLESPSPRAAVRHESWGSAGPTPQNSDT